MGRTSMKADEQLHDGPADPRPGEVHDQQALDAAIASGSIAVLPNQNTIERVRHDGGVSEATFDGKEWQSDDNSLRIWLNQVAAAGVESALPFGCNPPGSEAKRQADEAAKLATEKPEPVAVPE
jgi:hypothetical protein